MSVSVNEFEKALIKATQEAKVSYHSVYSRGTYEVIEVDSMVDVLENVNLFFVNPEHQVYETEVGNVSFVIQYAEGSLSHGDTSRILFKLSNDGEQPTYFKYETAYSSWDGLYWEGVSGVKVQPVMKTITVWENVNE